MLRPLAFCDHLGASTVKNGRGSADFCWAPRTKQPAAVKARPVMLMSD